MTILELWAYEADNTTFLGILDTAFAIQYQAELNATGAGRFRIPIGDATEQAPSDLILVSASDTLAITATDSLGWTSATVEAESDYVALGNIIRIRLDNTDAGAFVIEDINEDDLLTERVIEASGRGLLALLDRAIVWPASTSTYTSVQKTYLAKTMAYMIRDLHAEAVTRGVSLPTVDFTNTLDSAGASFADSSTINYRAGTTLLDIAEQHAGLGVDVWTTPAGVLQYFVSKGTDRSATVFFREGQNAVRAARLQTARQLANAILGEGQYTLSVQTDAASIAAYGRRERLVQHGNVSDAATLATLTQLSRDTWKDPQTMLDLRISDSLVPFVDYTVGDTISVDLNQAGIAASYRIRAINIEDDGNGVVVGVVLNRMIDEHLERMERALRRRLMTPIDSENHGNSDPSVGGWALTPTYLVRDTGSAATSAGMAPDDYPFYAGQVYASRSSAPFRVTPAGALVASNATITGSITATTGAIGGWTIGASSLTGGNATLHSSGYLLLGTSNDIARIDAADATYRLWIGHATAASAPFRVTKAGALTATSATVTGTFNWASGKGQLNTTGLTFDKDASNYVRIDDTANTLLRVYSNTADYTILGINTSTAVGAVGVYGSAAASGAAGSGILGVGDAGFGVKGTAAGAGSTGTGVYGSGNLYGVHAYGPNVALRAEAILTGKSIEALGGPVDIQSTYIELDEISDPAAPAANNARLYTKDNGSGKTQLVVRFSSGAVQVIATQP